MRNKMLNPDKEIPRGHGSTVIEDSLTRTRKLREEMKKRYERLIALDAPQILIDHAKSRLNITYAEYLLEQKQEKEENKRRKLQYAKENPIQKEIVDKIYTRMENLPYNYVTSSSYHSFERGIDIMSVINASDHENELYQAILNHAYNLYCEKYRDQFDKDDKRYNNPNLTEDEQRSLYIRDQESIGSN
jgi:hypothetical protein